MQQTSTEEKKRFDELNGTSYTFRIIFEKHGFDITSMRIGQDEIWHVYYRNTIVGTVTTRKVDIGEEEVTYTNLRLYKYLKDKFPKFKDFVMSEYFDTHEGKRTKFDFDKFDKYINPITDSLEEMLGPETQGMETVSKADALNDAVGRLTEYCDEYDEKFSSGTMPKDIRLLLDENERLRAELKRKSDQIFNTFLKV